MRELVLTEAARLETCFAPRSAAIIGASTNPLKFGGRALKFCLERGYSGRLYPVNARNDIVQGVKAYGHINDLPEAPDMAVIAVPAPRVRETLLAAAEKGCGAAIVYGARFAEAGGDGQARQDELAQIARSHGMRMIGPNCMGVISLVSGFVASFTSAPEHHDGHGWPERGSVSVASQSGAVGIQIFAQLRDRGLGLANWISTGNQADIDVADAIAYFAGDPATETIAVYMEDASRGLKLVQALELARRANKPVVVLKVGTTPEGARAAAGHTASMYVENRVVDDLFAQYGVLRAQSVNELIDLTAACNAGVVPASEDVVAVSVSGGGAVMISDAAARHGLNLVDFPEDALVALKETNAFVNDRNPIDISAPSMSNMEITGGHLRWGLERNQSTMIGYISHVPLVPRTRSGIMPQLLSFRDAHPEQLIALAANLGDEDRKALVRSGLAVFDDPTVATEAVAKLVRAGKAFRKPATDPSTPGTVGDLRGLLAESGIDMAPESFVATADEAVAFLDGPLVLKLSAPSLLHKTEKGCVETGLETGPRVRRAFERLTKTRTQYETKYPGLGIVASPQVCGVEVLIGVRRDPNFGPLIVLGSGGIDCEIFGDLTYRKAPMTAEDAAAMVNGLRVARKFSGWRGAPAVDRAALEAALVKLGKRAAVLPSFEINPLFVTESGVIGVDLVVQEDA
ncbi:MAG: acetate--CoA ligase family protein [Paracoccaceae bacterium]|nr:acetate--CoA ligase family protein [Paracoccaceae bacterium]